MFFPRLELLLVGSISATLEPQPPHGCSSSITNKNAAEPLRSEVLIRYFKAICLWEIRNVGIPQEPIVCQHLAGSSNALPVATLSLLIVLGLFC